MTVASRLTSGATPATIAAVGLTSTSGARSGLTITTTVLAALLVGLLSSVTVSVSVIS